MPPIFSTNFLEEHKLIKIKLSDDRVFSVKAGFTSKGNGTLQFGNLLVRVYDQHDDGIVYDGGELDIYLEDITGDGSREIILSGVLIYTGEQESDPAVYESLTEIITLDCNSKKFKLLFSQSDFSAVLYDDESINTEC